MPTQDDEHGFFTSCLHYVDVNDVNVLPQAS